MEGIYRDVIQGTVPADKKDFGSLLLLMLIPTLRTHIQHIRVYIYI